MSLYFAGWGKNFLAWGAAAPAPVTSTSSSAGGGIGPFLPPRGTFQITIPAPRLPMPRTHDDDDAILIHLLQ